MNRHWVGVALFLGIVLGSLSISVPAAYAQAEGIEVRPAVLEDKVRPGQLYQFTINVTNIAATAKTFTITAGDITGLDSGGAPVFARPGETSNFSLSSWFTLPQAPITIKAGETKPIQISVRVPDQASPGAHFGGVFFEPGVNPAQGTNAAIVTQKVGTVLSLQIAGDVIDDARLREFSTDKIIYNSPSVNFTGRIENMGNTLVRPRGVIQISDMYGKQVGTFIMNEKNDPVFPGSVRSFESMWNYDGFAIGRYQASVSIVYGDEEKRTITGVTSFWVLPLKLIGGVIGSILGVILLLYIWIRLYIRRRLRAMGVSSKGENYDYYAKKYNRSGNKLIVIVLSFALLCIALLSILFLMFA